MKQKLQAIENKVRETTLASQDWQKRLDPARRLRDETEREHLRLQDERRAALAKLDELERGDADDMTYLRAKAAAERLEGKITRAAEARTKARASLARLESEYHADISSRRSSILVEWRMFAREGEDELRRGLIALG